MLYVENQTNLSGGHNRLSVNTHGNNVVQQMILELTDFAETNSGGQTIKDKIFNILVRPNGWSLIPLSNGICIN